MKLLVICLIVMYCFCSLKGDLSNSIKCAWKKVEDTGGKLTLKIDDKQKYTWFMREGDWSGDFTIKSEEKGEIISMLDTYCGTNFIGKYLIRLAHDTLSFELVDDPQCVRRKFLPGKWVKDTKFNSKEVKTNSYVPLSGN